MSDFYTRTGDDGYTGFLGEGRLPKYHPRIEAIGDLDEATAALGAARAACQSAENAARLQTVQRQLYHFMAEVAAGTENAARFRRIGAEQISWLEREAELLAAQVQPPEEFILPGDSPAGGLLSLARAIVRRAERRVAELAHAAATDNPHLLPYLNRLSSLCFLLELSENQRAGKERPTLAKEA
jgi:cob(I)alamin adenosyltransferase